jgi:hypothetical protein
MKEIAKSIAGEKFVMLEVIGARACGLISKSFAVAPYIGTTAISLHTMLQPYYAILNHQSLLSKQCAAPLKLRVRMTQSMDR